MRHYIHKLNSLDYTSVAAIHTKNDPDVSITDFESEKRKTFQVVILGTITPNNIRN